MLVEDNMREVVKSLLEKTREKQIPWRRDSGTSWDESKSVEMSADFSGASSRTTIKYVANFPHSIAKCAYVSTGGNDNSKIFFSFHLTDDSLLGAWTISPKSADWQLANDLITEIRQQVGADWNIVINDIIHLTETSEVDSAIDRTAAPFFKWAAGNWKLTWFRDKQVAGSESVRIDDEGNYFVPKKGSTPYFLLRNVFFDDQARNVTFTKRQLAGPRKDQDRQTEVLEISQDGQQMNGYAQQDGHRLKYERLPQVPFDLDPGAPGRLGKSGV